MGIMVEVIIVKNAIITGANGGIGRAVLEKFTENGVNVWACVRQENPEFTEFCQKLGKKNDVWVRIVSFDLEDEEAVKEGVKSILSEKLPVDILVNNAGMAHGALFQMTSMDILKTMYQVNFFSAILITQLVVKNMMKHKRGSIINVVSAGAVEAEPGYLAYGSSKASLLWTTRMLAKELAGYNIRVNAVAPGLTDTKMGYVKSEEELKKVLDRTALGRMAAPEEVAAAIHFLASDEASYITGDILRVDGGRTA